MQREKINLTDGAPVGSNLRLQALGKGHLGKPLNDLDAIPIVGGIVVENHGDARKPSQRDGAQILQMRDTIHDDFDGDGDLLLHFFRRAAGPLGNDRDVVIGDVGIGLHRQIVEGNGAPDGQQSRHRENHKAVAQGKIYQRTNHLGPPGRRVWRRSRHGGSEFGHRPVAGSPW